MESSELVSGIFLVALAASCATCHPAETKLHTHSRMGNAMVNVATSDFAVNSKKLVLRDSPGGFQFLFRPANESLEIIAFRNTDVARATIRWILGAGSQGQTPIIERNGAFFESKVSYFPQLHRYGITIGQNAAAASTAAADLGRPMNNRELLECLGCHASIQNSGINQVTPGITCDRCHAGAEAHAANAKLSVANPGKLSANDQVHLCGTCHRTEPPVDDRQLENIRFQPLRLMKSKCFTVGQIKCTTCHMAHVDARRSDPSFYNEKCASCHNTVHANSPALRNESCIGCHMPQQQLHPALRFTDHYIRVAGQPENTNLRNADSHHSNQHAQDRSLP